MKIFNFILLARPINLFIAMVSVFIMTFIIDNINWVLLSLACSVLLCYMSAANILNDLIDIKADRINKPSRILVQHHINRQAIITLIIILFIIGTVCAFYLPIKAMQIALFLALPGILLYELILKRIPLLGNIVISLLVGIVFVFVAYSLDSHIYDAFKIMLLAFSLNLIREIIKDIQDIEGDQASGLNTLPIAIGVSRTTTLIKCFACLFIIMSFLPMYTHMYSWQYIPLMVFLIHLPLLYIIIGLRDDITPKECAKFSKLLKLMIINGIVVILISAK